MPRLSKIGAAALAAFGWTGIQTVTADFLVVAGGGGAGGDLSGGGGAGGFRTSAGTSGGGASAESTLSLILTQSYTVTVGAGGAGNTSSGAGTNGSDSVFSTITSTGGGGGAGDGADANVGGSGGGGSSQKNPANGTANQGYAGGNRGGSAGSGSGGGGGAGAVGSNGSSSAGNGGNGGVGVASSISGTSTFYAGGGGGGGDSRTGGSTAGTGGNGGGGNGGRGTNGSAATANTGGGGGGGGQGGGDGAAGGSGIVIVSYTSATQLFGGGTVTVSGGKYIHTFTTSGTLSPLSSLTASYLVVAGGGGGSGGGAGAGGLLSGSGLTIDTNSIYAVTVGAGGAGGISTSSSVNGSPGTNSLFSAYATSAVGGGGGGAQAGVVISAGQSGGSGGGGGYDQPAGTGTSGQGFAGGTGVTGGERGCGGGGGAGAIGTNGTTSGGGNGGVGVASSITGSSVTYAGGGGGGNFSSSAANVTNGTGGNGGGGNAAQTNKTAGSNGTANLGGGGGGAQDGPNPTASVLGGNGGSGVVIISYAGSTQLMAGGTVTVSGGNVIHTFTSSGYLTPIVLVNNSLRFRRSASAYLSRTFSTPTNGTTWTISYWAKLGIIGRANHFAPNLSTNEGSISIESDFALYVNPRVGTVGGAGTNYFLGTTQVFRDPSAWYHIVVALDTTQATSSNRVKVYVNGKQVTAFSTTNYPPQNSTPIMGSAVAHAIGRVGESGYEFYYDGLFGEMNYVDGQALTPNSFGTLNGLGIWQPIRYGGSYGTNGFYLPFTNTTSTTTLGYDFSPQGNNWTTNNISLTAGSTYDSMTDVPTLTSATAGNYAVLNAVIPKTYISTTDGNLKSAGTSSTDSDTAVSTIGVSSGKWYWEDRIGAISSSVYPILGAGRNILSSFVGAYPGIASVGGFGIVVGNGNIVKEGSVVTTVTPLVANDVVGFALDLGALTCAIYKNNSLIYTVTSLTAGTYYPMANEYNTSNSTHNYGQQPFAYTPPTGFVRLNTFNLPTPTIGATASTTANKYMNVNLWTGNGNSTRSLTGIGFQPDFSWLKSRSEARNHTLYDAVRGAGSNKALSSSTTDPEGLGTTAGASASFGYLSTFDTDGFSVSAGSTNAAYVNVNNETYVAWNWKANGAGSTNTAGSITSTVSANTTAGFSVVTYTGNATSGATVGHGLGVAPSMMIVKVRSTTGDWPVYHVSTGNKKALYLNLTLAQGGDFTGAWNDTTPTSTVFTLGNSVETNANTGTFVAYCFTPIAGYSAFGSYTGNGSTDGPFIYTGFRPRFFMIKRTDTTTNWIMYDTTRMPYNSTNPGPIYANLASAEETNITLTAFDILSNGFKPRNTSSWAESNASGGTYIYMAFAENPFKYANARQETLCHLLDKTK